MRNLFFTFTGFIGLAIAYATAESTESVPVSIFSLFKRQSLGTSFGGVEPVSLADRGVIGNCTQD